MAHSLDMGSFQQSLVPSLDWGWTGNKKRTDTQTHFQKVWGHVGYGHSDRAAPTTINNWNLIYVHYAQGRG